MSFHVGLECLKQEALPLAKPRARVFARAGDEHKFAIRLTAVASQFHRLAREPIVLKAPV